MRRICIRIIIASTIIGWSCIALALYHAPTAKENPTLTDRVIALLRAFGAYLWGVWDTHPSLDTLEDVDAAKKTAKGGKTRRIKGGTPFDMVQLNEEERDLLDREGMDISVIDETQAKRYVEYEPEEPLLTSLVLLPGRLFVGTFHLASYALRLLALALRFGPVLAAYPVVRLVIWAGMSAGVGEVHQHIMAEVGGTGLPVTAAATIVAAAGTALASEPSDKLADKLEGAVSSSPKPSSSTSSPNSASPDAAEHALVTSKPGLMAKASERITPVWAQELDNMWWNWLAYTLEQAGPTFVKLGQFASTREDVFSPRVCARLGRLREATQTHDWAMSEASLIDTLGNDWDKYIKVWYHVT